MTISKEDLLRYSQELDQNAQMIFDDRGYIRQRLVALLGEKKAAKILEFMKDRVEDMVQHIANIKGLSKYLEDKANATKK